MAERPNSLPEWATNEIEEVVNIKGNNILVLNKDEPTQEFKNSGELARQPLPRPYINWILNHLSKWIIHLDDRIKVGDYRYVNNSETVTTVGERFGGTWQQTGTQTVGSDTIKVFKRVL